MKGVNDKVQELPGLITSLAGVTAEKSSVAKAESADVKEPKDYLIKTSLVGLQATYVASLSNTTKKPFILTDLFQGIWADYSYGYLVACYAAGLLHIAETNKMINISNLNAIINKDIKNAVYERARAFDETNKANNFPLEIEHLKKIELYFGITS